MFDILIDENNNVLMHENIGSKRRKLILHPVRLRLLNELTGRRMTARQLARALPEVSQASLYRHLTLLSEAGVLEIVSERKIRGVVERTFTVAEGQSRLSSEDLRGMSEEEHLEAFQLFQAVLAGRFAESIRSESFEQLGKAGLSYNATALYLTEAERGALAERFAEALEGFTEAGPGEGRRRYTLASVVIPEAATCESADTEEKVDKA
ncbi:MAG: helix-turn-helix domain-containing protein [Acidobacteriota bacterium]